MPETKKYYHNLDVDNNKVINPLLNPLTTAQRTAVGLLLGSTDEGYVCFDTTLNQQYFWDGAAWINTIGSTTWGSITGTITAQTDLTAYLAANYYPLSTNPANYIDLTDLSAGTGISYNNLTGVITNSAPDQTVVLNSGSGINVTGTYPNFTIAATNSGTVTSVTASTPLASSGGTTPNITIQQASGSQNGYLSSGDWTTFNSKQDIISLTTTGTSGAATFIANTLNIPQYQAALTNPVTGSGTINYIPKWTGATSLGDGSIVDNGTSLVFGPWITLDTYTIGGTFSRFLTGNQILFQSTYAGERVNIGTIGGNVILGTTELNLILGDVSNTSGQKDGFGLTGRMLHASGSGTVNIFNIDPVFQQTGGTPTVRGFYYNPSFNTLLQGTNIAFQNTSGDIIHGNLATGGAAQMVTADSSGKLGIQAIPTGTVTSVGLTMPSAFSVASSPVTGSGTIAVTGAGVVSQYIRGDGSLANFPISTGGGSSVSYYLNGSVNQGVFGGVTYYEMNGTPVSGTGTDFTINTNGYIAQFITDAGDPNKLLIPAGNWNFETYFSASSSGGSPSFYIELYKYDGTTFTLIASNSATPENITGGTSIDLYFTALAVPSTVLLATDRLAVRFFVTHSGRTITMHTEDNHLSQIITTFSTGLTALNGLTAQVQNFAVGTSGTDFNISSATATHTFNLPTASATNRGALSTSDWTNFNTAYTNRITSLTTTGSSGSSTLISNVLNVPTYTLSGLGGQPLATNLTSLSGLTYASTSFVKMTAAGTFALDTNTYQGALTLTTTGTSGASTLIGNTLNIPQYAGATVGGSTGNIQYNNGTTFAGSNNLFWDATNSRLGIGTSSPNTICQINLTNTDFTNTNGAGSHIYMTNPSATGQNVVSSFIAGALVAKWRTDYVGNISWVAGSGGAHDFYTGGDFSVGSIKMRIFNGGNVQIATSPVGGANADAGFKLDVQGTTRLNSQSLVNFAPSNATDNVFKITNTRTGSGTGFEPACLALDNTATANTIPCDIRLGSSNPAGIRIYASNTVLTGTPTGAGLQFYTNASSLPGQVYFDSGANNSAALVFRTAITSGSITERMRIFAGGNVGINVNNTDAGFRLDVNGTARFQNTLTTAGGTISSTILSNATQILAGTNTSTNAVYRTINGGAPTTGQLAVDRGTTSQGDRTLHYDGVTDGLIFGAYNSNVPARTIARAGINITNLTNTAGSESGDMIFLTQSGGTAMTEKLRITSVGAIAVNGAANTGTSGQVLTSAGSGAPPTWTTVSGGGGGYTIVNVTSTPYNAAQTSGTIILLVDAATAGANVTINLPTAVGNTAEFIIKKIDSGVNTVTIDGSSTQTIDGALTQVIYAQYASINIVSNNANWFII